MSYARPRTGLLFGFRRLYSHWCFGRTGAVTLWLGISVRLVTGFFVRTIGDFNGIAGATHLPSQRFRCAVVFFLVGHSQFVVRGFFFRSPDRRWEQNKGVTCTDARYVRAILDLPDGYEGLMPRRFGLRSFIEIQV